jgi:hypothetical protein
MTSRDFVYWLQGYFEILDPKNQGSALPIGPLQAQCIREHLALVFQHEINPPVPKVVTYVPPHHTEPFSDEGRKQWQDLMNTSTSKFDPLTGTWAVC